MNRRRDFLEAVRVLGLCRALYATFVYRAHMGVVHRLGGHWFRVVGPVLPTMEMWLRCDWCGEMREMEHEE